MTELTSKFVKDMTMDLGADMVGIASIDRFEGAPPGHGRDADCASTRQSNSRSG